MIDEREMYELIPDEVIVNFDLYRKRPSVVPGFPCWDGGPVGGIVSVNWLSSVNKTVNRDNPWKGDGLSCKTFERAAILAHKGQKREYERAKRLVADYEAGVRAEEQRVAEEAERLRAEDERLGRGGYEPGGSLNPHRRR